MHMNKRSPQQLRLMNGMEQQQHPQLFSIIPKLKVLYHQRNPLYMSQASAILRFSYYGRDIERLFSRPLSNGIGLTVRVSLVQIAQTHLVIVPQCRRLKLRRMTLYSPCQMGLVITYGNMKWWKMWLTAFTNGNLVRVV